MKAKDETRSQVSSQERAVIDLLADEYKPQPMTPIAQAAFRQRLSDRVEQSTRRRWAIGFVTATAAAAALLFVATPYRAPEPDTAATSTDTPVLYAYVDPDEYSTESVRDYLPGEYRVIADVLNEDRGAAQP